MSHHYEICVYNPTCFATCLGYGALLAGGNRYAVRSRLPLG